MQRLEYRKQACALPGCLEAALPEKLLFAVLRVGPQKIEEIRLYGGSRATVTVGDANLVTDCILSKEEIEAIFFALCQGSPYAYRDSICKGFLSPGDGVRVGLCGRALVEGGQVLGVTDLSGLVIRIPHAIAVPVQEILPLWRGGLLIYAPPGVGKTTLLRSLALELSKTRRTILLDAKGEFFGTIPSTDEPRLLHLLTGFSPAYGMEIAIRNLGAECLLTDEIGSKEEAACILDAANRGVPLIATAHAKEASELFARPALCRLIDSGVFEHLAGLSRCGYGKFSFAVSAAKKQCS
ncbi:MAG: hypothetical protein IJR88_04135 [Clostridia bacterium]|nr:hypothetical protein [Clostridia bacterium]